MKVDAEQSSDPKLKKLLKKLDKARSKGDAARIKKFEKRLKKRQAAAGNQHSGKEQQQEQQGGAGSDGGDSSAGGSSASEQQDAEHTAAAEHKVAAEHKETARKSKRRRDQAELQSRQDVAVEAADRAADAHQRAKLHKRQREDSVASSDAGAAGGEGGDGLEPGSDVIPHGQAQPQGTRFRREAKGDTTLVLFYQYVEPPWSAAQLDEALKFVAAAAKRCGMTGRVRVAREGLNATITGPKDGARAFAQELRDWQPENFEETDFKYTDGLPNGQCFKEMNVWPVSELVGYGLAHHKAPPLTGGGRHLTAQEYHEFMKQPNTVIIDVRNAYESAIGHFAPPPGGAELIDPRMRKSTDFPGWLNSEETRKRLEGKNVMMYCTGGVRCERATALLRQLDVPVNEVVQLKGGIHRYLEEFKDGGFWAGKNYVFDKRFAHGAVEPKVADGSTRPEMLGNCASCRKPWDMYRGKRKCAACGVPLLVCRDCQAGNADKRRGLRCPTCVEDKRPAKKGGFKFAAFGDEGSTADADGSSESGLPASKKPKGKPRSNSGGSQTEWQVPEPPVSKPVDNPGKITRLFVGNLSFKIDEATLKDALPGVTHIKWVTDKETGQFYGSSFVEMANPRAAGRAVGMDGQKLLGRPLKINYAPAREGDVWPPPPEAGDRPAAGGAKPKKEANGSGGAGKFAPVRERPNDWCKKLFVANVSWEAQDEDVEEFFSTAGVEIAKVRWLTDKDTGDFRGCGFLEFKTVEETDKAITMHGKELKGRPVKIDWSE